VKETGGEMFDAKQTFEAKAAANSEKISPPSAAAVATPEK
jgi:hypothetical protein